MCFFNSTASNFESEVAVGDDHHNLLMASILCSKPYSRLFDLSSYKNVSEDMSSSYELRPFSFLSDPSQRSSDIIGR